MNNDIEIIIQIEQVNKEKNQIIFKPYSPEFKKPIEEYPSKAIDFTALDLTKDLEDQLIRISAYYIKQILSEENNEKYLTAIKDINLQSGDFIRRTIETQQLFVPETISTLAPTVTGINTVPAWTPPVEYTEDPVLDTLESTDIYTII